MSARAQPAARRASAVNERRLISCVRRYPLLYDTKHPEYLVFGRKADVWNEIADILGFSASKCKARWNSMRDGYRKSIRKNKARGQNGERPVQYKHARRMEFLRKFLRASGEIDEEDIEGPGIKREADDDGAGSASDTGDLAEGRAQAWAAGGSRGTPDASLACSEELASPSAAALPAHLHPVDAFLGCIGAMVKSLPPYYQAMAKAEIFAAAHKYELLCITGGAEGGGGGVPLVSATSSEAAPPPHAVKQDPFNDISVEEEDD